MDASVDCASTRNLASADGGPRYNFSVADLDDIYQHAFELGESLCCCYKKRGGEQEECSLNEQDLVNVQEIDSHTFARQRRRLTRMALIANIIFVIGSTLQVVATHYDFHWEQSKQDVLLQSSHRALTLTEDYAAVDWADIPDEIRHALLTLKQTQSTWNGGPKSQLFDKTWSELSIPEKEAAQRLGYNVTTWGAADVEGYASTINNQSQTSSPMRSPEDWKILQWDYLPIEVQNAFKILGYNRNSWESKEAPPPSAFLFWKELSAKQREQALIVGYTEDSWNEARLEKQIPRANKGQVEKANPKAPVKEPKVRPLPAQIQEQQPEDESLTAQAPIAMLETSMAPTKVSVAPTPVPITATDAVPVPVPVPVPVQTRKPSQSPTPAPSLPLTQTTTRPSYDSKATAPPFTSVSSSATSNAQMEDSFGSMFLIVSSMCFLALGLLNWIRDGELFHVCMVQGAVMMMMNGCLQLFEFYDSRTLMTILELVGYHLYFLESLYVLRLRKSLTVLIGLEKLWRGLLVADILFCGGAFLGLLMSYWRLFSWIGGMKVVLFGKIVSSWLWLVASSMCLWCTIALSRKRLLLEDYLTGSEDGREGGEKDNERD